MRIQEMIERDICAFENKNNALDNEVKEEVALSEDGIITYQVNKSMEAVANKPNPKSLWKDLWYDGELCCLFADTNLGKSILAVDIAREIAQRGRRVLYLDFELSQKQFQMRYTNDYGQLYQFPATMYRGGMDYDSPKVVEDLIAAIETHIVRTRAEVVIVDNLTWLCNANESGEDAGELMARLKRIKGQHDISMLVIAHTPKRDASRPLCDTDLAGSRKLANFFDSIFTIGRSSIDDSLRYIKQIKCRYGSFTYTAENVIICHIEKTSEGCTTFVYDGYGNEYEHLRERGEKEFEKFSKQVSELSENGVSIREMAKQLGVTKAKIESTLRRIKRSSQQAA